MATPNQARPTLGVVAICKNEERDLPHFLAHLLPWVDEIILVDDGSTDRTQAIARSSGERVRLLIDPMQADEGYASQRNKGIHNATCDWLLHMDVDERVSPELAQEIRQAITHTDKKAFRYYRLNYFLHRPMRGSGWQYWNKPQLARRGFHHFRNRVHEACVVDGGEAAIGQLQAKMIHLNDDGYVERLRKSMAYCQLEADKLIERGHRVRWYDLIWQPIRTIAGKYLLHKAHRDGIPGLILTLHSADAVFRAYALAWDRQNSLSRESLEQDLAEKWQRSTLTRAKASNPEQTANPTQEPESQ